LHEISERLSPVFSVLSSSVVATGEVVNGAAAAVVALVNSVPIPSGSPARDVLGDVISIVADRTGYPADMLDADAAIEADLGIDSIKRVEILSAFQRTLAEVEQSLLQGVMEKLTSARTLREIAERIAAALRTNAAAVKPA